LLREALEAGGVEALLWLLGLRLGEPGPCMVAGSTVAEPLPVAAAAYSLYSSVNLNDPVTWRSVETLVEESQSVVSRYLGVWLRGYLPTSGCTEALIAALLYARETRGQGHVAAPPWSHASVAKAARLLGLRVVWRGGWAESARGAVAVVATLGATDTGALDPLGEALEAAVENDAVLVVDACIGWLTRPALLAEVLRRGAVAAIDYHKHFTPPGSGALLAADEEPLRPLEEEAPYMPRGRQQGLLWTRSAAGAAAAAAALHALGPRGLAEMAAHVMAVAETLAGELRRRGVPVASRPWTNIVAFKATREALERLRSRLGLVLYPSSLPGYARFAAKWCHTRQLAVETAKLVAGEE